MNDISFSPTSNSSALPLNPVYLPKKDKDECNNISSTTPSSSSSTSNTEVSERKITISDTKPSLPSSKKSTVSSQSQVISFALKCIMLVMILTIGLLFEMQHALESVTSTANHGNFTHRSSGKALTTYRKTFSRLKSKKHKVPLCSDVTNIIVIQEAKNFFNEVHLFIIAGLEELGFKVRYIERNNCFHAYPTPSPSPTPNNTGEYFIQKPVPPCYEDGVITISTAMCITKRDDPWPKHPIFVNLEVLEADPNVTDWERTCLQPGYAEKVWNAGPIWDYSYLNIKYLQKRKLTSKAMYLPLRYYEGVILVEDSKYSEREEIQRIYDVGFIGTYTSSPRRKAIFEELSKHGLSVDPLFGWYGLHKDQRVRQAKMYLNIRFYTNNFETVRLFWLLSLGTFIVNEADPELNKESIEEYNNTMVHVPYNKIVETVLKYLPLVEERNRIADQGYNWVRSVTPGQVIGPLMEKSPVKGIPNCRIEY